MELALKNTGIADKWKEFLALIVGAGLYTVLNYFGQRFFAFAEKKKSAVQSETAVTDIVENTDLDDTATSDKEDATSDEDID